jgi:predicted transcriptional regulator
MRRGQKDIAAAVLEEVIKAPNQAQGRIFARAGITYSFRKTLLENGLVEVLEINRHAKTMHMTEKGREFLTHYRVCNQLLPA